MANSAHSHDVPLENYVPGAPLESILCTEELHRRPSRPGLSKRLSDQIFGFLPVTNAGEDSTQAVVPRAGVEVREIRSQVIHTLLTRMRTEALT